MVAVLKNNQTLLFSIFFFTIFFGSVLLTSSILLPLIFLVAIACLIAGYAAFKYPWIMLIPISVGSYLGSLFYFLEGFPLPFTLFQIFLLIGFLLFLLNKIYFNSFNIRLTGFELPILLFLGLIFFSLLYSPDRGTGLLNAFRFVVLLLFAGFILNTVKKLNQIYLIFFILTLTSIVLSFLSVSETILNPQIAVQNLLNSGGKLIRAGAAGLYSDPNRFAAILFLPVSFSLSILFTATDKKTLFISSISTILLLAGLISSFSRSGLISIFLIGFILVILFKKWKTATWIAVLGLIFILLIPDLRNAFITNIERIVNILTGSADDSAGQRVMLGIAGVRMFFDSYMFGVGFDGFSERFTDYYTLQQSIGVYEPHNISYTIIAELGLIGFLFYLYYLYVVIKISIQNFKISATINGKIISSTLLSTFIGYVVFYQFYGGALTDSNLMLVQALIFTLYIKRESMISGIGS